MKICHYIQVFRNVLKSFVLPFIEYIIMIKNILFFLVSFACDRTKKSNENTKQNKQQTINNIHSMSLPGLLFKMYNHIINIYYICKKKFFQTFYVIYFKLLSDKTPEGTFIGDRICSCFLLCNT